MTALDFRSGGLADLYAIPVRVPAPAGAPTASVTVSSNTDFTDIATEDTDTGVYVLDCVNLTIDTSVTLTLDPVASLIRATGTVTINGTINGDQQGARGGRKTDEVVPGGMGGSGSVQYGGGGGRDFGGSRDVNDRGGYAVPGFEAILLTGLLKYFPTSGAGGGHSDPNGYGGFAGANLLITATALAGGGTITLVGESENGAGDGAGGMFGVFCERQGFTGTITTAPGSGSSGGAASPGTKELFWVYERGSLDFDYEIRMERIDPTGREGRLVVR